MNANQNFWIIVFVILYIFFDIPPSNIMEVRSVLFVHLGKKNPSQFPYHNFFLEMQLIEGRSTGSLMNISLKFKKQSERVEMKKRRNLVKRWSLVKKGGEGKDSDSMSGGLACNVAFSWTFLLYTSGGKSAVTCILGAVGVRCYLTTWVNQKHSLPKRNRSLEDT